MATKTRKIPQEAWDFHKETILSLYLTSDLALDKLVQVMDKDHRFSATISQFEFQLKAWDARKNLKRGEWEYLLKKIDDLCCQGIQSRVVISGHPVSTDRIQRARRYCKGKSNPEKRRRLEPDLANTGHSCTTSNAWIEIQGQNREWIRNTGAVSAEATSSDSRPDSGSTPAVEEREDLVAPVYDSIISPPELSNLSPRIFPFDISFDNLYPPGMNQHSPFLDMSFIGLEHSFSQSFLHDGPSAPITFPTFGPTTPLLRSFDTTLFQPITFHWEDLPFRKFERYLMSRGLKLAACPSPMQDSSLLCGPQKLAAKFWQDAVSMMSKKNDKSYERNAYSTFITLQKLDTLLPRAQQKNDNINSTRSMQGRSDVDLHRLLLYSAANGFAGMDDIPIELVLRFLDSSKTTSLLSQNFRRNASPVAKSLAENLFRAAIESCDRHKIRSFLQTGLVDVNNTPCFSDGEKLTPIERAAQLQAVEVVHELLTFKADINKTYKPQKTPEFPTPNTRAVQGALELLISGRCPNDSRMRDHSPFPPRYLELIDTLIKSGVVITAKSIDLALTRFAHSDLAELLLDRTPPHLHSKLMQPPHSFLKTILMEFSDELATKVVTKLISDCKETCCDSCLIRNQRDRHNQYLTNEVFVTAALRGHIQLVRLLLTFVQPPVDVLSAAIRNGNQTLIDLILDQNLDISHGPSGRFLKRNEGSSTPLAEAIAARNKALIETLEMKGVLEHINSPSKIFPAILATTEVGDIDYMKKLLALHPVALDGPLQAALFIAAECHQEDALRFLLDIGAGQLGHTRFAGGNIEEVFFKVYHWGNASLITEMMLNIPEVMFHYISGSLINDSKPEDVDMLVFFCKSSRATSAFISACLLIAVDHNNSSMLHFLLGKGANPLWQGVLELAAKERPEMLRLLLEYIPLQKDVIGNTEVDSNTIRSIVTEVIERSDMEVLDILLKSEKFDINSFGEGCSPLLAAITEDADDPRSDFPFTLRLLDAGYDINGVAIPRFQTRLAWAMTPLIAAIQTRNKNLVQLLLDRGANTNREAAYGVSQTPLQAAAYVGSLDIVELLLQNGADVNTKAALRRGGTALQCAAASGNCNIVTILIDHGADIYASPSEFGGRWPIEAAAENGRVDMIQLLWNISMFGFPLEQCRKAVQLAEENGHIGCKELILQLAASSGIMPTLEG
ncbi:ankyrin [Rostrohypoxylon terebratum]|nr:ankyrin [Rostrohypoxylon terebratum]